MLIFRKLLVIASTSAMFCALFAIFYIHIHYANDMPRNPDNNTGRVFSITVNHGAVRYVTKAEIKKKELVEKCFFGIAAISMIILLVCQGIYKTFDAWNPLAKTNENTQPLLFGRFSLKPVITLDVFIGLLIVATVILSWIFGLIQWFVR